MCFTTLFYRPVTCKQKTMQILRLMTMHTVHEIDRQDELSLTCKKSLKYDSFRLGVFMDVVKKSDPRVKLLFLTLKKVCALYKNQRC